MSGKSSRIPLLLTVYERYLDNQDSADFVHMTSRFYSQGTLARLIEHPTPHVRRAAVFALGFLGDYRVNHVLGRAMHDDDRTVRLLAESSIRNVWKRAGSDDHRRQLEVVVGLNSDKQFEEASRRATELTQEAPWFAEAWNQRAVAHFGGITISV